MWSSVQRWRGVALIGATSSVALWLAASGQLVLYIHPRYVIFTVSMASLALVLSVAAIAFPPRRANDHDDHADHGYHDDVSLLSHRERALGLGAAAIAGAFVIGMLVIPPATLTSATAQQRQINATAADLSALETASEADEATVARFSVREWAGILRQTNDLAFFAQKPVTELVGFVTEDPDDPDNVFYVSRFVITCCAVDAQPLGVPVHKPGWKQEFPVDSWVSVTGRFAPNPSSSSLQPLVVIPDAIEAVQQPREPYLF
jgi:putative membrane protein